MLSQEIVLGHGCHVAVLTEWFWHAMLTWRFPMDHVDTHIANELWGPWSRGVGLHLIEESGLASGIRLKQSFPLATVCMRRCYHFVKCHATIIAIAKTATAEISSRLCKHNFCSLSYPNVTLSLNFHIPLSNPGTSTLHVWFVPNILVSLVVNYNIGSRHASWNLHHLSHIINERILEKCSVK